ncbi:MAG: hypothetical protein RPS47_00265 [Colwellia sp.]
MTYMKNEVQQLKDIPALIYIMGGARSGSTILEILLSNNPDIFGAGEMTHLIEDVCLANKICSCGSSCSECDVWSGVFYQKSKIVNNALYLSENSKKYDRHKGLIRRYGFGQINKSLQAHNQFSWEVVDTINAQENTRTVVDSSKYASRAMNLFDCRKNGIAVICLTRSAAGMIDSFSKKNKGEQAPKSFLSAAMYIFSVNLSFWLARRKFGDRCLLIKFETLMQDPESVLAKISAWSKISVENSRNILKANGSFDVGHIVTGNRLRSESNIKFNASKISIGRSYNHFERAIIKMLDLFRPIEK